MEYKGRNQIEVSDVAKARLVAKPHATYHILSEHNEGFSKVLLQEILPKKASPMHVHLDVPELVIVLNGILFIKTIETTVKVLSGQVAYIPGGVPHSFVNENSFGATTSIIMLGTEYSPEHVSILESNSEG